MIKKFNKLFENNDTATEENNDERIPEITNNDTDIQDNNKEIETNQKNKEVKKTEIIEEKIQNYEDFLTEGEGGGGVAYATNGNSAGMGSIVAPQPSSTPGDVAGSSEGSGDIPNNVFNTTEHSKLRKRKKKKNITKNERHYSTDLSKEIMYVTKYSDWIDNN